MDIDGLERINRIRTGNDHHHCPGLASPSPLELEITERPPYAFLTMRQLEERKQRGGTARRFMDPQSAADSGRPEP